MGRTNIVESLSAAFHEHIHSVLTHRLSGCSSESNDLALSHLRHRGNVLAHSRLLQGGVSHLRNEHIMSVSLDANIKLPLKLAEAEASHQGLQQLRCEGL